MTTPAPVLADAARFWRAVAAVAAVEEDDIAIGATPSDPVFARSILTLRRYRPLAAPDPRLPPVIVAHGMVGRASMIDLDPRRSLARDLLGRGVDLHVVDWGRPGRAERYLDLGDCVDDLLADAVEHVRATTGRRPALLGVCEGGVLAACLAARAPDALAGLVLAVTPIDTHADPTAGLTRWIRACDRATLEGLVDALGGLPGGAMGSVFEALLPARAQRKHTTGLLAIADDAQALRAHLRMERWIADRPRHPGEAARQMLVDLYRDNLLVAGRMLIDGAPVELGRVAAPALVVYGLRDHLTPPACARAAVSALTGAPVEELALDAGHIGVFVSGGPRRRFAATLADWLARAARSD